LKDFDICIVFCCSSKIIISRWTWQAWQTRS